MTEYHLYNQGQKPYDDAIREQLLISTESSMPQTHNIPRSRYAYVPIPNFNVDRDLRKYFNYTEGTSVFPSVDLGRQAFDISFIQIKSLVESEPVEAGMNHPAMDYLQSMIANETDRRLLNATLSNGIESWLKADILLCLTGLKFEGHSDYLFGIAAESLTSDDVRVRDAAVQALEAISMESSDKSKAAIWLLERQIISEKITWLRNYAEQIVDEYRSQK